MAIPQHYQMYTEFLQILSDEEIHELNEIKDKLAIVFNLSDDEKQTLLESGKQTVFRSRVGWTRTYLKKAGLILSPSRAHFMISEEGKKVLASGEKITDDVLKQYPAFLEFIGGEKNKISEAENDVNSMNPQEVMDNMYKKINNDLADDLLERICAKSPVWFEKMVVILLEKMGYCSEKNGTSVVTKASGDEGIDGIIYQDKLGFDIIYIQAKKWDVSSTIGRPEIQKFCGAIAGPKDSRGLFITTAKFSKEAIEYANKQRIILVDGVKLTELMIEYGLGTTIEYEYKIKRIDTDFFEDEN